MSYWLLMKQAAQDWLKHRSPRLGAALAYYAVFSLGPLLLIVVAVAGVFFGADAVRNSLEAQFKSLIGENGAQAIHAMIAGAASATTGKTASAVGIILLLVAALGVVVQLKDALNTIWEVDQGGKTGVWAFARSYVVSLAGILGLGFLLAVSLILSTALAAITASFGMSASEGFSGTASIWCCRWWCFLFCLGCFSSSSPMPRYNGKMFGPAPLSPPCYSRSARWQSLGTLAWKACSRPMVQPPPWSSF